MSKHSLLVAAAILTILAVSRATALKDGFNIYKDLLRGKGDESTETQDVVDDGATPKLFYFYRMPMMTSPNDGYDYMVSRDLMDSASAVDGSNHIKEDLGPRLALPRTLVKRSTDLTKGGRTATPIKRGPGSFIMWAISTNHPLFHSDLSSWPSSRKYKVGGRTSFIATMGKRSK